MKSTFELLSASNSQSLIEYRKDLVPKGVGRVVSDYSRQRKCIDIAYRNKKRDETSKKGDETRDV